MLSYCLKWRKNMEIKNWRAAKTTKEKPMILSKYIVCDSKKSRLIKEQEASGLLLTSGLLLIDNSPFQGIPTIDSILQRYKINEIVNKFLLAGDNSCLKCISGSLDLRLVLVGRLLKTKKEYTNLKKQEIQDIFLRRN